MYYVCFSTYSLGLWLPIHAHPSQDDKRALFRGHEFELGGMGAHVRVYAGLFMNQLGRCGVSEDLPESPGVPRGPHDMLD